MQAALLGDAPRAVPYDTDDFQYAVDLGLIRRGPDGAEAANPLYREVLVRQLSQRLQQSLPPPWWPWRDGDGRLRMDALLEAFRGWWRENADALAHEPSATPEAVPHLALCAFLQRVVNGGGRVHREFAAGRGAMDLLVEHGPDRFAIEIKRVRARDGLEPVIARGVAQLGRYLETVGLDHGWLVVFDQRPGLSWDERHFTRTAAAGPRQITVLGA